MEKLESLCTTDRDAKMVQPQWKTVLRFLKKNYTELLSSSNFTPRYPKKQNDEKVLKGDSVWVVVMVVQQHESI